MTLSRSRFTFRYGSLSDLVEAADPEHGGYGHVTWNVGPHAGAKPYGHGYNVGFVPHGAVKGAMAAHDPAELQRHAAEIGKKMDQGHVIHVPHLQFDGRNPKMDVKHAAAVHAAQERGAEHVPVVYHQDNMLDVMQHAGGVEKPGPAQKGQDPRFKWRWNGHGWYTKPSFNKGACPPGSAAAAGDKCVAGGEAPPEQKKKPEEMTPADLYGSQSLPPGHAPAGDRFAKPKRRLRPRPVGRADRRVGGGRSRPARPEPDVGPIPEPIDRDDVAGHTAARGGQGLDARIFAGRDAIQASMLKSGAQAAEVLRNKHGINIDPRPAKEGGDFYGCGLSGCAYRAPDDPDGLPMVIKMDKGENEATMAKLMLKHPDLGKLSSVPRYVNVFDTGVRDKKTGMKVYAIHREDLRDFTPEERNLKRFFGSFGMQLHYLSGSAPSMTRKKLLQKYDQMVEDFRQQASRSRSVSQQFDRVADDVRKLIARGVVPCDVHHENWGMRDHTGEVVMRDVGCSHFARDLG